MSQYPLILIVLEGSYMTNVVMNAAAKQALPNLLVAREHDAGAPIRNSTGATRLVFTYATA
jgi:hypothetical protein